MMKNFLLSLSLLFVSLISFGQVRTLNYQAVILDPKPIEIPGTNITGQPLKNGKVNIRFDLISSSESIDYEENHETTTDEFGLINLTIGSGLVNASGIASNSNSITYRAFDAIKWDSNVKQLKVSLSFDSGKKFTTVSIQPFNYTAYAFYAESVEYKNVRDSPTTLSFFNNDVGFIVNKDLDPLKSQIDQNQKDNISKFLIINQTISESDKKIADNTNDIASTKSKLGDISITVSNQGNQLNDQNNRINSNQEKVSGQINNLNSQIVTTETKVQKLENSYENSGNKSNNIQSDQSSINRYPSVKAVKDYVDQATQGVALQATVNGKEDKTSKSTDIKNDKNPNTNYPTVEAVKSYVLESALGIDTRIIIDGKENVNNKSKDVVADANSNDKYPTVASIKKYVDESTIGKSIMATIEGKEDVKYKTSDITEKNANYYPTAKAVKKYVDDATFNSLTKEVQTISINLDKTIISLKGGEENSEITLPVVPSATSGVLGIVKLAGDLSGDGTTAAAPIISNLAISSGKLAMSAVETDKIAPNAVNFAKIQNIASKTILGRGTAENGNVEALTLGTGLKIEAGVLNSTGGTLTGVSGVADRIKVVYTDEKAPKVDISENYVGQTSITTVGTITSGTWNGATVGVANGGTGKTSLTAGYVKGNGTSALSTIDKIPVGDVTDGESIQNKSTLTDLGESDILYPSQNAVKTYVDNATKNALTSEVQAISINDLQTVISLTGGTQTSTITLPVVPQAEVEKFGIVMLAGDLQGVGSSASNPIISNLAVNTGKLAESAVTTDKINSGAVNSDKLADNSITTVKINDAAVTSTKIANGSIINEDINSDAAIVDTKLAQITTTDKVANSATSATANNTAFTIVARDADNNFAAGTITANLTGKVNDISVLKEAIGFKITGGSTSKTLTVSEDATLSGSNTGDQTITLSGAVTGSGTGSFSTALSDLVVTSDKINELAVTTGKLALGAVETAKIATNAVEFSKIQNIDSKTILGRSSAANGYVETLTLGTGLTIDGGVLKSSGGTVTEITGTKDRISVSNGTSTPSIDISANYVGQTSITTVGTITSGTWSGTTVDVTKGGTGSTILTGFVKGNGTGPLTAVDKIQVLDVTNAESILNKSTSFALENLTDIKYPSTLSVSKFVKANTEEEHDRNDEKYPHKDRDNEYKGKNSFNDNVTILKGKKLKIDTDATDDDDVTNKKYVDNKVRNGFDDNKATSESFGSIKLANDLGGTAAMPVVVKVGGSTFANLHQAELAANASTALNTASTIVKRDADGKFNATEITSNLVGNVTGNLVGDVTGNLIGKVNDISVLKETNGFKITGGSTAKTLIVSEDATLSGSNTGDQTIDQLTNPTGKSGQYLRSDGTNASLSAIQAVDLPISVTTDGTSGASTYSSTTGVLNIPNYNLASLGGVVGNSNIVAGTNKTKISYDSKGLVTAGADATTADIAESTDKKYVTEAQITKIADSELSVNKSFDFKSSNLTDTNYPSTLSVFKFVDEFVKDNTDDEHDRNDSKYAHKEVDNEYKGKNSFNDNVTILKGKKLKIDTDAADDDDVTNKKYVDNRVRNGFDDNKATSESFGSIKLANDLGGTAAMPVVVKVGGSTSANLHQAELAANAATALNTASTIVKRDADGKFNATEITSNLVGNVTGNLVGDVTGNLTGKVNDISVLKETNGFKITGGSTAKTLIVSEDATLSGTNTGDQTITLSGAVTGSGTGSFSTTLSTEAVTTDKIAADAVTSEKIANGSIINEDIKSDASIVDTKLAQITTADKVANSATSATAINTANTIVARDASNNFAAGMISANVTGDLSGKVNEISVLKETNGFKISGGTNSKLLTVDADANISGTNTGDQTIDQLTNPTGKSGQYLRSDGTNASLSAIQAVDLPISVTTDGTSGTSTYSSTTGVLNIPNYNLASLGGVVGNSNIVAGTNKTKISYDSKGLVTSGADATTADIAESTDKKYVTEAQITKIADSELSVNKSTTTALGVSDILYPTQKAVKVYVDEKIDADEKRLDDHDSEIRGHKTKLNDHDTKINDHDEKIRDHETRIVRTEGKFGSDISSWNAILKEGRILIGNALDKAEAQDVSGDITLDKNGVTTLTDVLSSGTISSTWGDANMIPQIKLDKKGRVISITEKAISGIGSEALNLASGKIFVGSELNKAIAVEMSGDVTINNAGANVIGNETITSSKILDATILAADLAANSVTTEKIVDLTIVNADIAANAAIVDTKLATISTALKVSNSATTAIASNTANAIVARDGSGNFTAGMITAALSGNVTGNVLGNVTGDLTGNASTATSATTSTNLAGGSAGGLAYQTAAGTTTFTAAGTAGQVLKSTGGSAPAWTTLSTSDLTGTYNLTNATGILASANGGTGVDNADKTITLGGNLTTGAGNTSVTGSNTGDQTIVLQGAVTGSGIGTFTTTLSDNAVTSVKIADLTIVNADIANTTITDAKLANITTAGKVANSATTATSDNTIGTLVARDATGNFIANTITATLSGTASKANSLVGGSAGVLAYQTAAGTTTFTAAGTAGQVLKSTGGSAPAWTTLSTSDLTGTYNLTYATGILPSANGGTGVANTGKTITLGGNLIIAGNFTTTITSSGTTNVNLPLSGTLSTLAGTETLTNKTIIDGVANTQSTIDNSTKIATTAFVKTAISDAINEIDDEFSASYNQTEFTLSQLPAQNSKVRMYVNGSKISGAAYSVTGSKVTYYKSKNGNNNLNDARVQFEYYY